MKQIFLSSALAIAAAASAGHAEERKIEIAVGGLTCPSCSFIAASSLTGVPSVQIDDFVNGPEYDQGVYSVTFDDAKTSVESIIGAVAANGYPVELVPDTES